jgi:CBS-domain-containing membrane protein
VVGTILVAVVRQLGRHVGAVALAAALGFAVAASDHSVLVWGSLALIVMVAVTFALPKVETDTYLFNGKLATFSFCAELRLGVRGP